MKFHDRSGYQATAKFRKVAVRRLSKKAKNFRKFARNGAQEPKNKRARGERAVLSLKTAASAHLEQSDDLALCVDIDRVGCRHLGKTRHGHDLTADRHHELGTG